MGLPLGRVLAGIAAWQCLVFAAHAQAQSRALIIATSGYNSCSSTPETMSFMPQLRDLVTAMQKAGREVHSILGCHVDGPTMLMKTSSGPEVGSGDHVDYTMLITESVRNLNDNGKLSVHFIGHSWGAWANMAAALALPKDVPIGGFVTIDAISKVRCTVDEFIDSYFGLSSGAGCKAPPADFSLQQYRKIRGRARWWRNYYQTASALLHSGFIFTADENKHIDYEIPFFDTAASHREIDNDERVWGDFANQMFVTVIRDFQ